jgi:hypothetical protein
MYESSASRSMELGGLEPSVNGIHLESQTVRFAVCQQQLAVERRFKEVRFEGVSFLQIQFEQNHFFGVDFIDCNFSDVVFHGCVFIDCNFEGAVFSNSHFQNCTLLRSRINSGPVEGALHFTQCVVLGQQSGLPAGTVCRQNWVGDLDDGTKAPDGFQKLSRRSDSVRADGLRAKSEPATAKRSDDDSAIQVRQRENEQALPLDPRPPSHQNRTLGAPSMRFTELEKL